MLFIDIKDKFITFCKDPFVHAFLFFGFLTILFTTFAGICFGNPDLMSRTCFRDKYNNPRNPNEIGAYFIIGAVATIFIIVLICIKQRRG